MTSKGKVTRDKQDQVKHCKCKKITTYWCSGIIVTDWAGVSPLPLSQLVFLWRKDQSLKPPVSLIPYLEVESENVNL